ncbi:hypothetical protein CE91St65_33080 [[Clostridium] symbiosum]|nr:hypothetical protein CE91St65_33080 [[Clostridium] symbiosum]BDF30333.1 hypothetical protein CE91St66_33100 [[Clostridium] symbiosum]CUO18917.1 Uncharacterised protein [[Clostridium] symbiosum]SCI28656.1 Uncharacterised protein [uncultured Clostridium sp.]
MNSELTVLISFWLVSRIKFITDERFGIVLRGICFYGSGIKPYKGRVNDSLIGKGKNLCFHDVR